MAGEDTVDLPGVLRKLDLSTPLMTRKILDDNLPLSCNPFYYEKVCQQKDGEKNKELFAGECFCSCRANSIEHRIIKQSVFKNKHHGKILKEPVLKSIQNCIHHSHIRHKKRNEKIENRLECPNLNSLRLEEVSDVLDDVKNNEVQLDFLKLLEEVNVTKNTSRKMSSKPQSFEPRVKHTKKQKKSQSLLSPKIKLEQNNNSSASSSCAQQARIAATTNCDITIDELASYFETFVHIPKKMSSMAEMMYI